MSRYKELLEGYLRDALTESELQEFFQLVKENDELPDEGMIRGEAFDASHEGLTDKEQRQRMWQAVQAAVREGRANAGATGERSAGAGRESSSGAERGWSTAAERAGNAGAEADRERAKERAWSMGPAREGRTWAGGESSGEAERDGNMVAGRDGNTRLAGRRNTAMLTRRMGRWVGAAAAVVVLVLAGVYLLRPRQRTVAIAQAKKIYKNDVAPGKDGAVLRLADGTQIVLDSAGNGELSQQGGTRVIKKDNGQLVYEAAGSGQEILYNTLTTAKGKQFRMTLPDGTLVWLNSFSSLHYPTRFAGDTRLVEVKGEAYFEVAADAAHPFIVQTGGQEITVLGTHFNINSYEDEPATRTTLLEGAVRVSHPGGQTTLRPGEQASLGRKDKKISVAEVDTEEAVAWKNGYFHFDNADIQTVMRQLSRWYDVEVRYDGVVPTAGGDFKGDIGRSLTLAQVLKVLEQTRVHFRIEEDRRIVIYQ